MFLRFAVLFLIAFVPPSMGATADLVKAGILTIERQAPVPLSRLDIPPEDTAIAGARQATADNNTTGRFTGQTYELVERSVPPDDAVAALDAMIADGVGFVVTIANADDLLTLADHAKGKNVLLLNASAPDDRLRNDDCRLNVLHIGPSRAMLADGLAQYLIWKKWREWFLIHGSHPQDLERADAYRRSARKFGAKITEERVFEDTGGARRTDSGHVLVQKQMPIFTQRADDHDVVVVADESQVFGSYLPYRTWDPRPITGDAGLTARSWHPAFEGWGATQLQRRFEKHQGRRMTDLDYQAWVALRVLGEAATRGKTTNFDAILDYIRSDAFEIAAFKGQKLNFRPWNNQLRQGVLLADGKTVVTVSPQAEFLHQVTRMDTLGFDKPESSCNF